MIRLVFPSRFRFVTASLSALLLSACGTDDKKDGKSDRGGVQTLSLTADYKPTPVDMIVVTETTGALRNNPLFTRLSIASRAFAARMNFATHDFNLMFVGAGLPRRGEPQDGVGSWAAKPGEPGVLRVDTPSLRDLVAVRMAPEHIGDRQFRPFSALRKALENPANADAALRKDAKLAVLFLTWSDEYDETMLPDDLVRFLNEKKGTGSYSLNALTVPEGGCVIDEDDNRRTFPEGEERRRMVVKAVELAKGKLLSVCEASYVRFLEGFAASEGGNSHFPVTLPSAAFWDTIKVTVEGSPITGWRYAPGETSLWLPTFIAKGARVEVAFQAADSSRPNVVDPNKEVPPLLAERKLSPEEKTFLTDINPILGRSCGGCHGGGGNQRRYVDRFASVLQYKDALLDRIGRPEGDAGKMPRGGTLSPEDFTKLKTFLEGLK